MIQAVAIANEAHSPTDAVRRETFLRFMADYGNALARLAAVYLDDPADREDLVQEIATELWRAIPKFRGDASERTWLYRIAHNTAITTSARLRRRSRTEQVLDDAASSRAGPDTGAVEQLMRAERRGLLLAQIRELPAADRQVIALHFEGLSHAEIEQVTGASQGAIATRLSRIREKLTRAIRQREGA